MNKKGKALLFVFCCFCFEIKSFYLLLSPFAKMSGESKRVRNIDKFFSGKITELERLFEWKSCELSGKLLLNCFYFIDGLIIN